MQTFLFLYIVVPKYLTYSVGFFSVSADRPILFLLVIFWLFGIFNFKTVRQVLKSRIKRNKSFVTLFSLFIFFNFVSVFFSQDFGNSLKRFTNFFIYSTSSFFVILSIPLNKKVLKKLALLFLVASAFICLYGVLEVFLGENIFAGFLKGYDLTEYQELNIQNKMRADDRRIQASFTNPVVFGQYIVLMVPILMYFKKFTYGYNRYFKLVIAVLIILTYFTKSRASLLILFMSIVYGLYYFLFLSKSNLSLKVMLFFCLCFIIPVGFYNVDFNSIYDVFGGLDFSSDENREKQLLMAIPIIANSIWTGVGFGMGASTLGYGATSVFDGTIDNYFLSIILDAGVLAFLSFSLLVIKCFKLYFSVHYFNKFMIVGLLFFIMNLLTVSVLGLHPLFYFLLALLLNLKTK